MSKLKEQMKKLKIKEQVSKYRKNQEQRRKMMAGKIDVGVVK